MGLLRRLRDRFIAWNHRPREMTADEVAALLRKFLANTATHSEWDYFCTGPRLADPELDEIRAETDMLYGPRAEPYTSERLQALIARAEAIAAR
jgi:hypothetical protein